MDQADALFRDALPDGSADGAPTPDAVWRECGQWLRRTAYRVRERARGVEVDDLIQQGILAALEARPRYRADLGVSFLGFVKPRIFGAMIDFLGTSRREVDVDTIAEIVADPEPDVVSRIIEHEDQSGLVREIEALPVRERMVIALFYLEEFSNREIAQILEMTEGGVTRVRQRALVLIAQGLSRADDEQTERVSE